MRVRGRRTPGSRRQGSQLPREIWVLVASAFLIAIGFGVVAPSLPSFAASFDVGVTAISFTISIFALARLCFAPVSGKLVAAFGERRIFLCGLTVASVSTGACAFAMEYWQLLMFRALAGVGSTMFTVSAVSLLVRLAPPHLRGRAAGLWATGFLLGNVAGPIVGGSLVAVSLRTPFLAYACTALLAALVSWFFLRRSKLLAADDDDHAPAFTVREALRHRAYRASMVSAFANGWTVFGVRMSLIPLFVVEVMHASESISGLALAVFAAGNAMLLMIAGRVSDTRGRKPVLLTGLAVLAVGTAALSISDALWLLLAASVVAGMGAGLLNPSMTAVVADVIGDRARGGPALAGFQMAADVGAIIGPLAAGAIADNVSYGTAFAVTALLSVIAGIVWLPVPETLPAVARSTTVVTHVTGDADAGNVDRRPQTGDELDQGGEWSRPRTSRQGKRAEEGDDDLENHPSQPIKRRHQSARVRPRRLSEERLCQTGSAPDPDPGISKGAHR